MVRALVIAAALAAVGSAAAQSTTGLSVRREAVAIDRLVDAGLRRAGVRPTPPTDDATFVRRAYLQIVGRIPTGAETAAFLTRSAGDERSALIDRLLASPGHVSHSFNYWADLLRVRTRLSNQVSGEPYIHWLKESLVRNEPYDQLVRRLLTADGPAHARGNGATGYYLRDRGMPEDNMANTARVFLGTRLECAQCHNHPFDRWTQRQFFEMTAFTGGMRFLDSSFLRSPEGRRLQELGQELRKEKGARAAQALRRMMRGVSAGIDGSGAGIAVLPKDYRYDDAAPGAPIAAHTMFGQAVDLPVQESLDRPRRRPARRARRGRNRAPAFPEIDSRAAYADWLTAPDNPRFTLVIANRMWQRAFGLGLIEPVDDFKDDTEASDPELMEHLAALMVKLGYDLREFERVLYNTKAWQRQASPCELEPGELLPGPALRRMSAEQMWDSLLTLALDDADAGLAESFGKRAEDVYRRYEEFIGMSDEDLRARLDREMLRYTDPERYRQLQREERAARTAERRAEQSAQSELQKKVRRLRQQLQRARRQRDRQLQDELAAELKELQQEIGEQRRRGFQRGGARGLLRASELTAPAPAGHLLREFGQSDRDQIEASHEDANVPQVLSLLNGFVVDRVLQHDQAALMRALAGAEGREQKIRTAFLSMLNREPTPDELALWQTDVAGNPTEGYHDLIWTLVNTHEFRFIQ